MIEVKRRERTSPRAASRKGDKWDSGFIVRRSLRFCMLDKECHCRTGQCNAENKKAGYRYFLLWTQRHAQAMKVQYDLWPCVALGRCSTLLKQLDYVSRPERPYNCSCAIIQQSFASPLSWRRAKIDIPWTIVYGNSLGMKSTDRIGATFFVCLVDNPCDGP